MLKGKRKLLHTERRKGDTGVKDDEGGEETKRGTRERARTGIVLRAVIVR